MKAPTRCPALAGLLTLAAVALAPLAASADPPRNEHRLQHRKVMVVGPHGEHSVALGALARRAFLGVQLVDLTPELRRHFGVPGDRGVLVSRVVEDSPADAAGIAVGDLIVAIDGEPLRGSIQLVGRLGRRREGDRVELELHRAGSRLTVEAMLAENERRQIEIGRFLWPGEDAGKQIFEIDPEEFDHVITVDPESISESVRSLIERIEAGELPGLARLDDAERQRLERRLEELEERLREMERRLESED